MITVLKKIYHSLSHIAFIRWLGKLYVNGTVFGEIMAYFRLKRTNTIRKNKDIIRVVFLAQNIQVWGKIEAVCNRLIEDDRFEVTIIALKDITDRNSESVDFFIEKYKGRVPVLTEENVSLQDLHPEYVFYTRPYDQYLPKPFKSSKVSAYAKICYCSYCFSLTKMDMADCMNKKFFRNVSLFFAENKFIKEYNTKCFRYSHHKGVRQSKFLGYPILDGLAACRESENAEFTVLWTPRWSDAKEVGGSNFLNYKNEVVNFAKQHQDIRLIFRPHPLTFYHFTSTGQLTAEDVKEYTAIYAAEENMVLDERSGYKETFLDSSVLVSDISSMVMEWLVSEKPIIFCDTEAKLNAVMEIALQACYIAHSWEDVQRYVLMLKSGTDPKKEIRKEIRKKLFGTSIADSDKRIVSFLFQNASKGGRK